MTNTIATPYASCAAELYQLGWSPIPLPAASKRMTLTGWTGKTGRTPNSDQIGRWILEQPAGNIALRLPKNVVGIDVDAYDNKNGATTLAQLEAELGQLPDTCIITSRTDGVSGIRLYQLPAGIDEELFRGGWAGIDVIRHGHRYVVAPGSIHPDTKLPYKALGQPLVAPDQLPELPKSWCEAILKPTPEPRTSPTPLPTTSSDGICVAIQRALDQALADLAGNTGSRHDATVRNTLAICRLGEQGHTGSEQALIQLMPAFINAVAPDREGGQSEAKHEYESMCGTANTIAHSQPTPERDKGCCGPQARGETSILDQLGSLAGMATSGLGQSQTSQTSPTSPQTTLTGLPSQRETVVDLTEPTPTQEPQEPSSWQPVDLTTYLDGTWEPPTPTILERTDGHALYYPGLVHSIYGESESGKSWITQIAAVDQLNQSNTVGLIDFESHPGEVINRLLTLGAHPDTITDNFHYIQPEQAPTIDDPAWHQLLHQPCDLWIIDGVTESLVMFGAKTESNDEVTAWFRHFPKNLAARTGAAVILVDHVPKNKDDRGRFAIGAQAKLAAINGAAYIAEPINTIAPGHLGHIELRVAKDRPGGIRQHAGDRRNDRTQHMATITLDSRQTTHTTYQILTPEQAESIEIQTRQQRNDQFRPTILMEKISLYLEAEGASSGNQIRKAIGGKATTVDQALQILVDEKYVTRSPGPRQSILHHLAAEYREANELAGHQTTSSRLSPDEVGRTQTTNPNDLVPTSSPPRPGRGAAPTAATSAQAGNYSVGDSQTGRGQLQQHERRTKQDHLDPTNGTNSNSGDKQTCHHCNQPLHPSLIKRGETSHPECGPHQKETP